MKGLHECLSVFIFFSVIGICHNLRNSYTAAVVDYLHIYADYPKELLQENIKEYDKYIRNASREYADIIIFPEFGLVDIFQLYEVASRNISELDEYSTFVPNPKLNIIPCEDKKLENYGMQLVNISCAARMHNIYTVINLLEKDYNNETGNLEFFNTNVVFNRLGEVIAKYRKVHLSEEPFLHPGTELVTFTTDFNVTFGTFICFDMLFQYPAIELMSKPEVTDIIFTTSWYSETPFLQALSIQHGYAKANGVNLLASGLQEPYNSDGGSAIYLADGTIADMFITNKRGTRILIRDVPVIKKKRAINICENSSHTTSKAKKKQNLEDTDIDNFRINKIDLENFAFVPLNKGPKSLKRICSGDFCCNFNITVDNTTTASAAYIHKLVVYKGLTYFGSKINGGIRVCSLVACLNNTNESCGYKINSSLPSVTFKNIHIEAILDNENNTYEQPTTLKADLTPISEYIFCKINTNDSKTKITMAITSPQTSLMTFGIYGRLYSKDIFETTETDSTTITPEEAELNVSLIVIIVIVSTIILVTIGGLLYSFCTRK